MKGTYISIFLYHENAIHGHSLFSCCSIFCGPLIVKYCRQSTQPRPDPIKAVLIGYRVMGNQPDLYLDKKMALLPRLGSAVISLDLAANKASSPSASSPVAECPWIATQNTRVWSTQVTEDHDSGVTSLVHSSWWLGAHTTFKLMVFSQDDCCKHWAVWIIVLYDPSSCGFDLVVTLTDYLFLFLFMYWFIIY